MDKDFILVFITTPSIDIAKDIAHRLVEDRLAACVNMLSPIRSFYIWQGEKNDDTEVLLIVKSRAAIFQDLLVPAVRSIHPYEVPEILAVPLLMGSQDYLDWMDETIHK